MDPAPIQDLPVEEQLPAQIQPPLVDTQITSAVPAVAPVQGLPIDGGVAPSAPGISADEIALYDRQIRLWGVAAQEKIRSANILLITIRALGTEIAKNLCLAGISSLTILDSSVVTEPDLGAQFFLSQEDIGRSRAEAAAEKVRKLNPRVSVIANTADVATISPSFFTMYDVVIATDLHPKMMGIINTATRVGHKPFYAAGVHGFYGFIFSDLIEHKYLVEREKSNRPTELKTETRTRSVVDVKEKKENGRHVEMVTKQELYSTWLLASDATLPAEYLRSPRRLKAVTPILSCFRALWEYQMQKDSLVFPHDPVGFREFTPLVMLKHKALGLPESTMKSEVLRKFLQNLGSEIAPVTAVLGGQLAQDVINVLGARQQPIQNMVVFDGDLMEAPEFALHPEGALGVALLPISAGAENGIIPPGNIAMNGVMQDQPTVA